MNFRHFLSSCDQFWRSSDFLDSIGPSRSLCRWQYLLINYLLNQDESQQVVTTSQILLESLLHRIGNCCLILSAILFLGQIINASVVWDLEASSVLTGFGFSVFLFMSWACIDSVYGKGASEVSLFCEFHWESLKILWNF